MTASPDDRFTIRAPHGSFVVDDRPDSIDVILRGEYDISSDEPSQAVLEVVGELLGYQPRPVVVDMAQLSFLDAAGIRFLLRLESLAKLASTTASVCNANRNVRRLFAVVDLDRFLDDE
jgi:anti-anti-sigma factor